MADSRTELEELRRLDELESRAAPTAAPKPRIVPGLFGKEGFLGMGKERVATPEQDAAIANLKAHPWGSGIPKLIDEAGGKVTDAAMAASGKHSLMNPAGLDISPEFAAKLGYGANVALNAIPAFATSFKPMGAAEPSIAQKPADWLMQSAIKPTQADRVSGAAERAIHTMQQEGINATSGGMGKISDLARGLESDVQKGIAASPESVGVASVGSRLRDVHQKVLNQVNPEADVSAVRGVWDEFRNSPQIKGQTDIPVQLAQALKSGTYRSLGGKSYGEVGSTAVEAQKSLARGLREEIAAKVPDVVEPLKREAALMNVKDVALNRVLGEANKNPLGLAALRMDDPLSAMTFMADKSALAKSLLSHLLYQGGKPSNLAPLGMTAGNVQAHALAEKMRQKMEE